MDNINRTHFDSYISWTDKLTICPNRDIVEDCSGKIVGHVIPKVYKELTKYETLVDDMRGDKE
jgi:hypothetical protein